MRVLQLTTYDEDDSKDPLNEMRKAASLFDSKLHMAQEWLDSPTTSGGGFGGFWLVMIPSCRKKGTWCSLIVLVVAVVVAVMAVAAAVVVAAAETLVVRSSS